MEGLSDCEEEGKGDGEVEGLSDCEDEGKGDGEVEGFSDCEEEGKGDGEVEGFSDCEEWRMMRVRMVVMIMWRRLKGVKVTVLRMMRKSNDEEEDQKVKS